MINEVEDYPSAEIRIEGDRIVPVSDRVQRLFDMFEEGHFLAND